MNDSMTTALSNAGDFVQTACMRQICEAVQYPDAITLALLAETERLASDPERADAARRFHRELFDEHKRLSGDSNRELLACADGAMLAAVVYAGAIPQLWERYYAKRGIAAQILIDTVQDLAIWMETHRKRHGQWGLSELGWLHIHMTGGLFRTGRLQFQPIAFPYSARVFRNRLTGEHVVLSDEGVRFHADGQLAGDADSAGMQGGEWTSAFAFDGRHFVGHPISRLGAASRETVRLPADTWNLTLQKGDDVLNVHIPEGGRMSHDACLASYASAARFFGECFPEQPFRAYVCSSWLLSPEFRDWLPEQSNIRQFQSDYHLLPLISDETQILERVFDFGTQLADLPKLAAETSLQRVVYDHLTAGDRMHNGCGFILMEESGAEQ
ncbi:hypothetical protein GXP70_16855 [Paenibacillus lycopersici]|uniref:DUF5596 domain-containing protein n=1 Tax=Paenibacillus lycopersici TaxID=2704462 RepID=A0A6C0FXP0_9BACL|nr:acyltransferase domain-containing protein [Paenibacillus lycopersici]QHT61467.1 hypothetical protein GXP70_16855 [Paenibacillus lycopersici]